MDFSELSGHAITVLILVLFSVQHFQDSFFSLIDRIKDRLFFPIEDFVIGFIKSITKGGKFRNVLPWVLLPDNTPHLADGILKLLVNNIGLTVVINCQHVQSAGEDLLLLSGEKRLHRLIVFGKLLIVFSGSGCLPEEFQRGLNLNCALHQFLPGCKNSFSGVGIMLIFRLQAQNFIDRILRIALEILHDRVFIFSDGAGSENFFDDITDCFFILFVYTDAFFHQKLFRKGFLRDKADHFFFRFIVQIDCGTVHCEAEIAALEKSRNQPVDIIFHKTVGSFHKAVLHRFHGCLQVYSGIAGNKSKHIIQRMRICLSA